MQLLDEGARSTLRAQRESSGERSTIQQGCCESPGVAATAAKLEALALPFVGLNEFNSNASGKRRQTAIQILAARH